MSELSHLAPPPLKWPKMPKNCHIQIMFHQRYSKTVPPVTQFFLFFKLQIEWKPIHLTSVYSLTYSLTCPYTVLESYLKLVPGFRAW